MSDQTEQELRKVRFDASLAVARARQGTSHHKLAKALKVYEKAKEAHEAARTREKNGT